MRATIRFRNNDIFFLCQRILHLKLGCCTFRPTRRYWVLRNSANLWKTFEGRLFQSHKNVSCVLFSWRHPFSYMTYSNPSEQEHNKHIRYKNGSFIHPANCAQFYWVEIWLRHGTNECIGLHDILSRTKRSEFQKTANHI